MHFLFLASYLLQVSIGVIAVYTSILVLSYVIEHHIHGDIHMPNFPMASNYANKQEPYYTWQIHNIPDNASAQIDRHVSTPIEPA